MMNDPRALQILLPAREGRGEGPALRSDSPLTLLSLHAAALGHNLTSIARQFS